MSGCCDTSKQSEKTLWLTGAHNVYYVKYDFISLRHCWRPVFLVTFPGPSDNNNLKLPDSTCLLIFLTPIRVNG